MRALIRNPDQSVRLQTAEEPMLQAEDEVKIRIVYCTLCRDDMHAADKFSVFGQQGIVGHEATGVIVQAGDIARQNGFSTGKRVMLMPMEACGVCKNCLMQKPHYCPEMRRSAGVFAEYVIRKYTALLFIPDQLSFQQANLMEPVGDVVEAIGKLEIDYSSQILLIGAGFTGLVFLQLLRFRGAKEITVIEPIEQRRQLACQWGADHVYDAKKEDLQITLLQQTDFQGFDVVIDTSARADIFEFALPCMVNGGTIELFAYMQVQGKLVIPVLSMYVSNIKLIWTCLCGVQSMKTAATLIAKFQLEKLITLELPIEESEAAYQQYLGTSEIKIGVCMSK
ncbi:MAG: alcohol dehydrogenase catalytic domain-containing protein [Clostridia bacterium]